MKTNKTAGTSIEIALSKFCGPKDIITPISCKDEKIRKELGYRGPQNYLSSAGEVLFYNHISASAVRNIINDTWDKYYKFCFERNPWDRLVSLYFWRKTPESQVSISNFIDSGEPQRLKDKGYEIYTIDGEVVVDKVCKYENINEELEWVRRKVGIPEALELPRAKSGFRKDKRHYRDILSDNDKAKIQELFKTEISMYDYEW